MRRVLMLAYHFPPVGGGGVQRTIKFVHHLPSLGWEPVVLTGSGTPGGRWTPEDASLAAEIPDGLEIVRLQGEPRPSGARRKRAERWLGLDSPFRRWWIDAATTVGARVPTIDLVYASMSPFESGEAAAGIARALRCPWVADLRDPWALDEVVVYPTGAHRAREIARMRRVLTQADAVVMNTPEASRRLSTRFPKIEPARLRMIPNGYDQRDFDGPEPQRDDETFRIVHAGYLHTELGHRLRRGRRARRLLGGWEADVDLVTRSHVYLLEAVQKVVDSRRSRRMPIEVHLAGVASAHDRTAGPSEHVQYRGYLPHTQAVSLIRSADLLFLPMHDLPPGTRSSIVPGKTYEYLASGRPILAAVPDGDARDLLAATSNAYLCRPSDTSSMAVIVAELLDAVESHGHAPTRRPGVVLPYERRRLAESLAGTFDSVVEPRFGHVGPLALIA